MDYILGIDGGGSHTRALLADPSGNLIARGAGPASNPRAVGVTAAAAAIQSATAVALTAAGLPSDTPLAAACLGLAGVGRPADRAEMLAWAESVGLARRCSVVTDVEPVIAAGTPDGWGVALISGTGSCCFGRAPDGRTLQVGGWGYLLGDEGSGYDLALRGLRLATQTADGRAAAHRILAAILAYWNLHDPIDLIAHVYRGQLERPELANLTRPLLALADAGDLDALGLLDQSAADLAKMALTAANRLELQDVPLALAGGLLGASSYLRERLLACLGAGWNTPIFVAEPALGTLVLARRMLLGV